MTRRHRAAIIGSGNIGTDLLMKLRRSERARRRGDGRDRPGSGRSRAGAPRWTWRSPPTASTVCWGSTPSTTSRWCSTRPAPVPTSVNDAALLESGRRVVDLTPAAIGPFVVPAVNMARLAGQRNLNMVTCGGQATIPVVAALRR